MPKQAGVVGSPRVHAVQERMESSMTDMKTPPTDDDTVIKGTSATSEYQVIAQSGEYLLGMRLYTVGVGVGTPPKEMDVYVNARIRLVARPGVVPKTPVTFAVTKVAWEKRNLTRCSVSIMMKEAIAPTDPEGVMTRIVQFTGERVEKWLHTVLPDGWTVHVEGVEKAVRKQRLETNLNSLLKHWEEKKEKHEQLRLGVLVLASSGMIGQSPQGEVIGMMNVNKPKIMAEVPVDKMMKMVPEEIPETTPSPETHEHPSKPPTLPKL